MTTATNTALRPLMLAEIESAATLIYDVIGHGFAGTPQYAWPLLGRRAGCDLWVKHENHSPVGAFKVRGGIVFGNWLRRNHPDARGMVCATVGNHGQAIAYAARRLALTSVVVVPRANSREKNAAMEAQGAEVIEHGRDFQESLEYSSQLAAERQLFPVPSFNRELMLGASTYALELFRSSPPLDTVYVPIGLGSGICGVVSARDVLNLKTKVVGVSSAGARAYSVSFAQRRAVDSDVSTRIADGIACRRVNPQALEIIFRGVERVLEVTDDEVEAAMRAYYTDTHNLAEGAGATGFAGALQERSKIAGKRVAVVLSGGNVDREVYDRVIGA